jgi:hypothetical protein
MLSDSLSTILSSSLCSDPVQKEIKNESSKGQLYLRTKKKKIKSFAHVNVKAFLDHLIQKSSIFTYGEGVEPS